MRITKIMANWNETKVFATAVCSGCEKKISGEENFCPNCGRKLSKMRMAIPSSEVIDAINDLEKRRINGDGEQVDVLDRIDKKMFGEPSGKQKEVNKEDA